MSQQTYIYGRHAVESIAGNHPERIIKILIQRGSEKNFETLIQEHRKHIRIEIVAQKELDNLAQDARHQGIMAICHKLPSLQEQDLEIILHNLDTPAFLLLLDTVQDPHNLGACLRTADAAGVHAVIAPKDKSVGLTPTVSKVASGAAELVPFIQVTNLSRTMTFLKEAGIWLYGADEAGSQSLYQTDLRGSLAFVLGAEGSGLRRLTREQCDYLLKIPMAGTVESLNVSVAAGVLMFETVRQRLDHGN